MKQFRQRLLRCCLAHGAGPLPPESSRGETSVLPTARAALAGTGEVPALVVAPAHSSWASLGGLG